MEGLEECIRSATKTGKPWRQVKPEKRGGALAQPGGRRQGQKMAVHCCQKAHSCLDVWRAWHGKSPRWQGLAEDSFRRLHHPIRRFPSSPRILRGAWLDCWGSWRQGQPRPGAWALADGGILFLDEFSEWPKPARESLRHIMETGRLELHRADGAAVWTSQPWIVAATNLCPCGQATQHCICQPSELRAYRKRLTAPLLERFPVQLDIGNDSSECKKTWAECRAWVQQRGKGTKALAWSEDAELAAQDCGQMDTTSRRLNGHLRRLSEGHCEWRDGHGHVLPEECLPGTRGDVDEPQRLVVASSRIPLTATYLPPMATILSVRGKRPVVHGLCMARTQCDGRRGCRPWRIQHRLVSGSGAWRTCPRLKWDSV